MKLFITSKRLRDIRNAGFNEGLATGRQSPPVPASTTTDADVDKKRDLVNEGFNFYDPNIVAFSVERMEMGHLINERTIVGYYFQSDFKLPIKEGTLIDPKIILLWQLYCSRRQHNELVTEFKEASKARSLGTVKIVTQAETKKILKG